MRERLPHLLVPANNIPDRRAPSVSLRSTAPDRRERFRPPFCFQTRLNQVTRSEPSDNLRRVRVKRCGFGAGAPEKIKTPCVRFDGGASAFRSFYSGRGCPCLENRFAEQTGKTVKGGLGSPPKLFSFLSFGYKREDKNNLPRRELRLPQALRAFAMTGFLCFAYSFPQRELRLPRRGFATPRNDNGGARRLCPQ